MGLDYKKKYLKYKNKYLEAKKIYGGGEIADESIQVKIDKLREAIEGLRNSGISDMIDGLLTKCNECKTQEEVAELEEKVEELRKQVAEAKEGKQNVEERVREDGELEQMPEVLNDGVVEGVQQGEGENVEERYGEQVEATLGELSGEIFNRVSEDRDK